MKKFIKKNVLPIMAVCATLVGIFVVFHGQLALFVACFTMSLLLMAMDCIIKDYNKTKKYLIDEYEYILKRSVQYMKDNEDMAQDLANTREILASTRKVCHYHEEMENKFKTDWENQRNESNQWQRQYLDKCEAFKKLSDTYQKVVDSLAFKEKEIVDLKKCNSELKGHTETYKNQVEHLQKVITKKDEDAKRMAEANKHLMEEIDTLAHSNRELHENNAALQDLIQNTENKNHELHKELYGYALTQRQEEGKQAIKNTGFRLV